MLLQPISVSVCFVFRWTILCYSVSQAKVLLAPIQSCFFIEGPFVLFRAALHLVHFFLELWVKSRSQDGGGVNHFACVVRGWPERRIHRAWLIYSANRERLPAELFISNHHILLSLIPSGWPRECSQGQLILAKEESFCRSFKIPKGAVIYGKSLVHVALLMMPSLDLLRVHSRQRNRAWSNGIISQLSQWLHLLELLPSSTFSSASGRCSS